MRPAKNWGYSDGQRAPTLFLSVLDIVHLSKVESKQLTDAKISTAAQYFDEENDEQLYVCGVRVKWHITT